MNLLLMAQGGIADNVRDDITTVTRDGVHADASNEVTTAMTHALPDGVADGITLPMASLLASPMPTSPKPKPRLGVRGVAACRGVIGTSAATAIHCLEVCNT